MKRYTPEMISWVEANYKTMDLITMTDEINRRWNLNVTKDAVSALKKRKGFCGSPRTKIYSDLFPREVCNFIKANYKGTGHKPMCELLKKEFGREYTPLQIKAFYRNNHLDSGLTGHWMKGVPSYNKGKSMPPEAYEKCKGTMFKAGQKPHNILPVGTEIVTKDGYHRTKIAEPNKWEFTHRLLWEQNYGPIPEEMRIIFRDENRDNITIENLEMVSIAENAYMNIKNLRHVGDEYFDTAVIIAKVAVKIGNRKKAHEKARRKSRKAMEEKG